MSTRVLDRIEGWEQRRFTDGYRRLQQFADREFSGVVRVDGVELFMTRGVVIAVRGGDIETFESSTGTAHEAPSSVLPLLAVMQEQDSEVRDSFYTEQTPVSAVDETLSEGNFTGYIELSEDVLSGDYYIVYHVGKSTGVAFVGQSGQLLDGREAFDAANDEVGIYQVRPADIEPVDLPEPEPVESDPAGETGGESPTPADTGESNGTTAPVGHDTASGGQGETAVDTGAGSEADTELRTVPSVDPSRTARNAEEDTAAESDETPSDGQTAPAETDPVADGTQSGSVAGTETGADTTTDNAAPVQQLEKQVQKLERERDELREQLETVRGERDELRERLERVDQGSGGTETAGELTPLEAMTESVVFVRYHSQGELTLKEVHGGEGRRETLQENLRLEVYGGFDGQVTVDGTPYETFVEATLAYEFLEWAVTDLPFDIRATGNRNALQGLYDTVPEVDHADFQSSVGLDGATERFDVVFRDQRERPLLVATVDTSREPVVGEQMEQLVTAAERVGGNTDRLQGAFLVTRSYFDGEALAIADEATKSTLLSRDRQKSFVSLSRKQGYHLCLVEAREGSLHLALPEL